MMIILKYIRPGVLLFTVLLAIAVAIYTQVTIASPTLQTIRLVQYYGFLAIFYLYAALLATPLFGVFPNLPFRVVYVKARRAIGVSAFLFALLHGTGTFFFQLGGFAGLGFLDQKFLLAVSFGSISLFILLILTLTATDIMVRKLGPNWKKLHRTVYLAGLLVVIHILMLGTHFADYAKPIPQTFFGAVLFLCILEIMRIDRYLAKRFNLMPTFGYASVIGFGFLAIVSYIVFVPSSTNLSSLSLGIHAQHIALAQQAQQAANGLKANALIPGLNGDPTKRYSVTVQTPPTITANQDVVLTYKVFDASSGNPVSLFRLNQEKIMHEIIVSHDLQYFNHQHPQQNGTTFTDTIRFPKDGVYHIYLDFQPLGGIEQQIASTVTVGTSATSETTTQPIDNSLTKTFGSTTVTLESKGPLQAQALSIGKQTMTFRLKDSTTGQPVTDLKPYLAAFGHLVLINQQTYDYIHVHPYQTTNMPLPPSGGPTVEFQPLGLYGPIKPGTYKAFAQFNRSDHLFVADFTIKVE